MGAAMKPDEFIGRVRDLLPAICERAPRAEQLRRLQDDTLADFQDAGLFRAMQPKRYGGFELDPGGLLPGGHRDRRSLWLDRLVFAVIGVHNWHLALFPRQAQEDVWGEDDSIQLSTSLDI
jgi:3-hydroxy-9,10-secoandrosta-1,3,5(10)-triene-9,17-dione monooxygenase